VFFVVKKKEPMIHNLLISILTFITLTGLVTAGESNSVNLDLSASDERMFEVLRRIQTRSGFNYFSQNFPQRRTPVIKYLTGKKRTAFDSYFIVNRFPLGADELIQFNDTLRQNSLYLSPILSSQYLYNSIEDSTYTSISTGGGMRVYGTINSNLTYYTRGHVFTESSNQRIFGHQFDPDEGESCSAEVTGNKKSDTRTCNRFEHYLLLDLPWLDLKVGRDNIHMGPGYFSSLTSQRQTPPYYLIEGRIDFSDWFFMDNYFLKMTDTKHAIKKYQHIHRFEFKPHKSLSIAFQDVVIYQERDVDLKYVLPLTPLAFSEDNNGGRDNDAMSTDFLFSGIPYLSIWGEVFIDDLLGPGTFFDDFWENRWAVLAGFQAVSPWDPLDADLVLEFSRVEPWTYTGRKDYTSFNHFNVPSSSRMGPNSQTIDMQLSFRPVKFIELQEHIFFSEKGTDSTGSVLGVIHKDKLHGTTKEFLGQETETIRVFTHKLRAHWNQFAAGELYVMQEFGSSYDVTGLGTELILSW